MKRASCIALWMVLLSGAGCHRPVPIGSGAASANGEIALIQLSEARAWQRRADLHLGDGDVTAAIADLQEVLGLSFPPDVPEAEDVKLDACARLAKLQLSVGGEEAEDRALAQIEVGRKLSNHDSFFRAHLEMIAADVYEARASRLTDTEAKKAEKRQAIEALDRAIQIDRRLQRSLLNLPTDSGHASVHEPGQAAGETTR